MLDAFASPDLQRIRCAFEETVTWDPKKLWQDVLRLSMDLTGAGAVGAFGPGGELEDQLTDLPAPRLRGLDGVVARVLKTGQSEWCGNIIVYPLTYGLCVLGAIVLQVEGGTLQPEQFARLQLVLFYAALFLAAAKWAEFAGKCPPPSAAGAIDGGGDANELPGFIARGITMKPVVDRARRFAGEDGVVLITGEHGTGKDKLALAIHLLGPRRHREFHEVELTSMSDLLEAELYGVAKGYATQVTAREGHCQAAGDGTLFLNEIGELLLPQQSKLLRLIQKKECTRLGSTETEKVEARIIAATNRDLPKAVAEGRFRPDLYNRLNVLSIALPPLRENRESIPALVKRFAGSRPGLIVDPEAIVIFTTLDLPGNTRQLENAIERLAVLGDGHITAQLVHDDFKLPGAVVSPEGPLTQRALVKQAKKTSLIASLARHDGDLSAVAKELGVTKRAVEIQTLEFGLRASRKPR